MVKHEPHVFQISSWLHALDEIHIASKSFHQHLENVDLFLLLPWKDIAMDVLNYRVPYHTHDAIKESSLAIVSR
jgi:hypothetical protein